ncbi:DUF533 domain-containing protein [Mangrovicoccus algicola]|uniref:Tellurite resistance TerB family protein n=1 Tax=Mangrovicoccus algicola TaxID=2771008 RepID=A0A8J7CVD8_9RHOB|nr:DUF533 domain-containing protein [Mangrovicoccus algicola]MBE3638624.1 tellurite resistance TerB family protein [Mangrovicoccus algicola]
MSFMKTLVSLGIGFAAARGLSRFGNSGGMQGLRGAMEKSGTDMAAQMASMAEKMGLPGGGKAVEDMMSRFGLGARRDPAELAGLGGMMNAMSGMAAATGGTTADLFFSMTEGTAAGQMAEENARLMIRAMIQAAKADGEIDAAEQEKILGHLGDASPEEIAFVRAELAAPLDPMALARDANEQSRAQVYAVSLMAITVDSKAEIRYLDTLAAALQLDPATREAIHARMGVTAR